MRAKHLVVAASLVLLPTAALAGEQANGPTVTGETGYFSLFTGDTLPQGRGSFGLYFNNWDRIIEAPDDETEVSLDWSRVSASFGYGITDAWEFSVMAPYEDFDFDNGDFPFAGDPDSDGFGRVRVGTKFRVSGDPGDPTTMAINLWVDTPTGDENDSPDGDDTGFGGGLNWRASNWVFNVAFYDSGGPALDQQVLGGLGYAGAVSERLDWITELFVTAQVGDAPIEDAVDLTTGGRYWMGADRQLGLQLRAAPQRRRDFRHRRALPARRPPRPDLLPAVRHGRRSGSRAGGGARSAAAAAAARAGACTAAAPAAGAEARDP